MIVVVQRVSAAQVTVDASIVGQIGLGLAILVGVERGDSAADADLLARKVVALRIFPGRTPMDLPLAEAGGAALVVSQFTLAGSTRKGNRPSFTGAADPELANTLYLRFADSMRSHGLRVETGRFGAHMAVELVNDGPVTFILRARDGGLL